MHDVCIPAMTRNLAIVFEGSSCERLANRHPGIAPSNHYKTEDGEISIFCMTESHWQKLLKLMHRQDLNKDRASARRGHALRSSMRSTRLLLRGPRIASATN